MKPENNQPPDDSIPVQDLANSSSPLNPQTPEDPVSAGGTVPSVPTPTPSVTYPSQVPAGINLAQPPSKNESKYKKIFGGRRRYLFLAIPTLLLIGGVGATFGYYLPNKPERIWSTALSRTAKGYDKLVEYVDKERESQGLLVKGSFKLGGDVAADGSFEGKSNDDNGEFSGSISASGLKVNLDLKTIKSPGNSPDIYFKVSGLDGLGDLLGGGDEYVTSTLNSLENQWYFIDHTLFDQLAPGSNSTTQVKSEDIKSILTAIGDATREFVLTDDASKGTFTVTQNVGKEVMDGRNVYHYKIAFNKANIKSYATKLCDNLKASNLKNFFDGDAESIDSAVDCQGLQKSVDNIDDAKTADAWVDLETKLISKVKIEFSDDPQASSGDTQVQVDQEYSYVGPSTKGYVEFSQNYTGGDVFPFSVKHFEEEKYPDSDSTSTTSSVVAVELNMKTDAIKIVGETQSKSQYHNSTVKGALEIIPSTEEVKVEAPKKAKNLIQLLNDIGFGDLLAGEVAPLSIGEKGRDTERKTDINALASHLEAYNAQNGRYPTLADVNDTAFRSANMQGLDSAALQDPQGAAQTLSGSPSVNVYSYVVAPANCDNGAGGDCLQFTLTATLEEGGTYVKQSLN